VTATKPAARNETRFLPFGEGADFIPAGGALVVAFRPWDSLSADARTKVAKSYEQEGLILTEHAALEDGNEGKLAATLFLESDRSRAAATATVADPALRALLEQQRALEDQIGQLKLRVRMDPAHTSAEKLLVELAVKTRAIRELEGKK
jgi:hypothetical protein